MNWAAVATSLERAALLACVCCAAACTRREAPPAAGGLLGGAVARAGDVAISAAAVGASARAEGVSPRQALERLVEDALVAQERMAAAPGGTLGRFSSEWPSARVLARQVARRLHQDPRLRTPPTEEELEWHRVTQAIVLRDANVTRDRAVQVAQAVAVAVAGARDDVDFEARAKGVPHAGVGLSVEDVPEFDAKGMSEGGTSIDPSFVAAAFGLHRVGDTSGVIESPFGWYVLRLSGLRPESASPEQDARSGVDPELVEFRARRELDALLVDLRRRGSLSISVVAGADDLMAKAYAPFGDAAGVR